MALSRVGSRRRGLARTQFGITTTGRGGGDPLDVLAIKHGLPLNKTNLVTEVPDPIEFVVSDRYLNRPNLYPRQATFLKLVFLRSDMFTQYDHDVIGEWEETFRQTGNEGLNPGVHQRIEMNLAAGRRW